MSIKKYLLVIGVICMAGVLNAQSQPYNIMDIPMVYVQGSAFTMGACPNDTLAEAEEVQHWVKVKSFYMSPYEVTQALWQAVMGMNPSRFKGENRPVERVSWHDCLLFIDSLNKLTGMHYRLPTEAEWEYAAKGGHAYSRACYSGANFVNTVARYEANSGKCTWKVASRMPNDLNLYDMSGNVWEWCADVYAPYDTTRYEPSVAQEGTYRVCRGGAYNSKAAACRVSARGRQKPNYKHPTIGFRLVMSDD